MAAPAPIPAAFPAAFGAAAKACLILFSLSSLPTTLAKRASIGINNNGKPKPPPPPSRTALGDAYRRRNNSRTAALRDPRTGEVEQMPEFDDEGAVVMDPSLSGDEGVGAGGEEEEPVIEIDYSRTGADGSVVIKSHELMLRHAPGVFGFASECELDVAADHCAEVGTAAGDPFCTSGVIHTCKALLDQCDTFETHPPCDKDRNPCCKCAFQMCPLSRAGCARIDSECYHEGDDVKEKGSIPSELEAETVRAIKRVFNMLDLNGDTYLDRSELAMLLSAFSSAHTTSWDVMSQPKYLTICSELGADSKRGVSVENVFRAFARRRGVLYNLMLSCVRHVKEGRQTQLEKHQASVQTIFAICDTNGDGTLADQELDCINGDGYGNLPPGERLTVTRLKMLYLELHFRDLDEDLIRIRQKAFGGTEGGLSSKEASAPALMSKKEDDSDVLVTMLVVLVLILLGVVIGLVYKLVSPREKSA